MRRVAIVAALLPLAVLLAACGGDDKNDENREEAVLSREANFNRAEAVYPAPTGLTNFPIRGALVEYTERQDLVNHPWYIYILAPQSGTPIGYFVGKTYPISSCNFLSSSERFADVDHDGDSVPDFVVTAPSYDGIFYGGGGASAACESMFFFDVTTNALMTFSAPLWFASDAPLNLDVPELKAIQAPEGQ